MQLSTIKRAIVCMHIAYKSQLMLVFVISFFEIYTIV